MTKPVRFCTTILFCAFFIGCIAPQKQHAVLMEEEKIRLSKLYYEKAISFEQQNDLIEAKKNHELAITADPLNMNAKQGLLSIDKQLNSLADKHYEESQKLYKKGKYSESKRYLLIALRLWPEHIKARQELISNQSLNILKYVVYTITKGDTLSKISKKFYGDFKQSGIIAQINNISDAGKIRLGMKLKIPEIKEYPFINQEEITSLEHLTNIPVQPEIRIESKVMYQNLGMEFFNEGQFQNAIIEFKKVLNSDPLDQASTTYISKSYYQMGLKEQTGKKYIAAIEYFEDALSFTNDCSICKKKIKTCRNTYLELHYKKGMEFFNEQNLDMAVSEWDLVQTMDKKYKKVAELLNKAKTIQTNIDALKKSEE